MFFVIFSIDLDTPLRTILKNLYINIFQLLFLHRQHLLFCRIFKNNNFAFKDNLHYPFLRLTSHETPRTPDLIVKGLLQIKLIFFNMLDIMLDADRKTLYLCGLTEG